MRPRAAGQLAGAVALGVGVALSREPLGAAWFDHQVDFPEEAAHEAARVNGLRKQSQGEAGWMAGGS